MPPLKMIERLVYIRPDGTPYILHAPPVRAVLSQEGFGTPPLTIVSDRAPFQNGSNVRSFTLGPRPVQLVITQNFCSREEYWAGRQALLDAIRPNRIIDFANPGSLRYYLPGNKVRQLDVMVESGPGFAPPEAGWRAWSFTEALRFLAYNPSWYDPTPKSLTFTPGSAGTFPATFPIVFTSFGADEDVSYAGTWIAYPTITAVGPITGLHVHNHTTDDMIALDYELPDGYSLEIVLNGQKTITRSDGTNLLQYVTSDSDLTTFGLQPDPIAPNGVNEIHVTGSGTGASSQVSMTWNDRYIGI